MRNLSRFLMLPFIITLLFSSVFSQQTAEDFFKQALELLSSHKHDAAIVSFSEAIKLKPDFVEAYLQRSKARENNQRDLEGAFSDIEKVIELNPTHGEAYFQRSKIRSAQFVKRREPVSLEEERAHFKKILADLDSAIGYEYKTKDIYAHRAGIKCSDRDDCRGAIADYDAAIQLAPDDYNLYINRSWAKFVNKDLDGAIAGLREVVSRYSIKQNQPDNPQTENGDKTPVPINKREMERYAVVMALVNLGSLIGGGKGENEIALQIYNQAVELDSKSHIAYAARGRWKITFGDLNDALEDLNRAVELRGKNPLPANLIDRGVALLFQGKSDEAQQDFDKAVEIEPMLKGRINIQIEAAKKRRQQIR